MTRRIWRRNKEAKLVEVKKKPFKPSAPYIGKNPWARQTKVEFNVSTMEESIKRMKGDK